MAEVQERRYFHGPCCDATPDCYCDSWDGTDFDGNHRLPYTAVPIGDPPDTCTVSAGSIGDFTFATWGGVYICTADGTATGALLTGSELGEACLAVCLADPYCKQISIGSPAVAEYYGANPAFGGYKFNCGLKHHHIGDAAVQSVRSTRAPSGSHAAKESTCWTGYDVRGCGTMQPAWAPAAAAKCFDPSAATKGGGMYGRYSIGQNEDWWTPRTADVHAAGQYGCVGSTDPNCEWSCSTNCEYGPFTSAQTDAAIAILDAIDSTCDGWDAVGAPALSIQGASSVGVIIGVAGGGAALLLLLCFLLLVIKRKRQAAVRTTPQPSQMDRYYKEEFGW